MVYLYAITETSTDRASVSGLCDQPVRYLEIGPLCAAVSAWPGGQPELTEAAAWAHERVVEELMGSGPVLPARFGTVLEGERETVAALEERREALATKLELVRGAVELGVRGAWTVAGEVPPVGEDRGTEYLGAIARRHRLADSVHRPLASLARASRTQGAARAGFASAYLVDRADTEAFRARVESLGHELAEIELTCTGPWPPYSFAEQQEAAA